MSLHVWVEGVPYSLELVITEEEAASGVTEELLEQRILLGLIEAGYNRAQWFRAVRDSDDRTPFYIRPEAIVAFRRFVD